MTHTSTEQPEALRLARKFEEVGFMGDHRFAKDHWCRQAAAELRSQHASIAELEAQLSAIGAGGVEPLRKRECLHQITEPDHFRGATEMVTAARQPLDDKAILQGRTDGYDAEDPPEGWAFAQGVRFAERAHGITGEPQ